MKTKSKKNKLRLTGPERTRQVAEKNSKGLFSVDEHKNRITGFDYYGLRYEVRATKGIK